MRKYQYKYCRGTERTLLASALACGRDEQTTELASELALCPELAGRVPEGLPLAGEVTETGGNTHQEGVKVGQVVGSENGVLALGRGVQELEDVLGKSLGDPEERQ